MTTNFNIHEYKRLPLDTQKKQTLQPTQYSLVPPSIHSSQFYLDLNRFFHRARRAQRRNQLEVSLLVPPFEVVDPRIRSLVNEDIVDKRSSEGAPVGRRKEQGITQASVGGDLSREDGREKATHKVVAIQGPQSQYWFRSLQIVEGYPKAEAATLGPKSRAGLRQKAVCHPSAAPIPAMTKKRTMGSSPREGEGET